MSKKILIAEDEKPMAKALELKLKKEGYNPKVVYNGAEALKSLESEKFSLLLMDLMMPVMDGFALLTELKEKKNNIPVIVLSNLGQEEDLRRAKKLGAKDYFIKSDTPIAKIVENVKKFV